MKLNACIYIILFFTFLPAAYTQTPAIEAQGNIRLVPIKLFSEGAEAGMIFLTDPRAFSADIMAINGLIFRSTHMATLIIVPTQLLTRKSPSPVASRV